LLLFAKRTKSNFLISRLIHHIFIRALPNNYN
jgi:hypothetical protein